MPPVFLFDLSDKNLNGPPLFDKDVVSNTNPQQYEMQQLDGILWHDTEQGCILGYKDITDKEFWVRGHIPSRPLMPGVIMIEAAAQLISFFVKHVYDEGEFLGFGGINAAKFRSVVEPGCRLYLLGKLKKKMSRKYIFDTQGVVDGKMVFEAEITGMRV